jgi:ATP-dependent Lon protease
LAAKIGDIKTVLIPKGNVPDLKKIPKEILAGMKIIPVEHGDQVLRLALELDNPEDFLMRKGIGDLTMAIVADAAEVVTETSGAIKH